jgi:hypothetical protein
MCLTIKPLNAMEMRYPVEAAEGLRREPGESGVISPAWTRSSPVVYLENHQEIHAGLVNAEII